MEFIAVIAGVFYLKKTPAATKASKLFVKYLILTLVVELIATYAVIGYFSDYKYFSFIKGTDYVRNNWLYNIFTPISVSFLTYFFISQTKKERLLKITYKVIALYLLGVIAYYFFYVTFFTSYSIYTELIGCLLVLTSIVIFFFEVLRSDLILNIKKMLALYIAVGVFLFQLCTTPIFLLSDYFRTSTGNYLFIELQINVVLFANIFMYSCFTLGFLICSRKKKYS